jgi:DNA-binding PadR family transcriptional regulator
MWRPSPGSVYPTLQMLEDEGLVRSETRDGQRAYELTDTGREQATAGAAGDSGPAPWDDVNGDGDQVRALRDAVIQTLMAAKQLSRAGRPDQLERGIEVVQRARKELYRLLAED